MSYGWKVDDGANPPPYSGQQTGFPPYPQQAAYPTQQAAYPTQSPYVGQAVPPSVPPVGRATNVGSSPPGNMSSYNSFGDDFGAGGLSFSDATIRRAFIRKVFAILMCQLLVTVGFISLFVYHEGVKGWVLRNTYLVWVAFGVVIVTLLILACCGEMRRKYPWNFALLGIFTLAESFMLGTVSATYKADEVVLAIGICAAVCFALTVFAMQTKWDFTACGGILLCCLVVLVIFGIVAMFFPGKTVNLVYSSLGALLFSVYLVFDVQLMMGGKHKYSISPEEYIFAALNLYVDVINIFMYILSIIGNSRN